MSKIYSSADSAVVRLGRSGEDSLVASEIQGNFAGPIFDLFLAGKLNEADLQSHTPDDPSNPHASYLRTFGLRITFLPT